MPFCGKTVDMSYLAKHESVSEVVGVDGIQKALDDFRQEHPELNIRDGDDTSCPPQPEGGQTFRTLRGNGITLLKGNYLELEPDDVGGRFDLVWDRGSIVAVAPEKRAEHVAATMRLLRPEGVVLLSTVDRREGTDEGRAKGPPFSVPHSELKDTLFRPYASKIDTFDLLEEHDEIAADPVSNKKFIDQGLTSIFEVVTMIKMNDEFE